MPGKEKRRRREEGRNKEIWLSTLLLLKHLGSSVSISAFLTDFISIILTFYFLMVRHVRCVGKHLVLTVKTGLSWSRIWQGVQVDEILTPLTFSDVSRPEAYSRHENEHTQTCWIKFGSLLFSCLDKPASTVVRRRSLNCWIDQWFSTAELWTLERWALMLLSPN